MVGNLVFFSIFDWPSERRKRAPVRGMREPGWAMRWAERRRVGRRGDMRRYARCEPVVGSWCHPASRARGCGRGPGRQGTLRLHARRRTARRRASSLAERPPGKQSDRSVSDPAGCDLRSRCLPCESKTVDSGRDHGPVRATSTSVTRSDVCSSCFIVRKNKTRGVSTIPTRNGHQHGIFSYSIRVQNYR